MSASSEQKPRRLTEIPFRMIVLDTYFLKTPKGHGLVVKGRVEQGTLNKGEPIIVEGHGKRIETADYGFVHIRYENPFDHPPDIADLWFRGMSDGEIEPGMIITRQGES